MAPVGPDGRPLVGAVEQSQNGNGVHSSVLESEASDDELSVDEAEWSDSLDDGIVATDGVSSDEDGVNSIDVEDEDGANSIELEDTAALRSSGVASSSGRFLSVWPAEEPLQVHEGARRAALAALALDDAADLQYDDTVPAAVAVSELPAPAAVSEVATASDVQTIERNITELDDVRRVRAHTQLRMPCCTPKRCPQSMPCVRAPNVRVAICSPVTCMHCGSSP
jgi:hypothetical protein